MLKTSWPQSPRLSDELGTATRITQSGSTMHPIPPEALESFKQAYRADFGRDITDAEAEEYAATVLNALGFSLGILAEASNRKATFESSPLLVDEYLRGSDGSDGTPLN